jgi:hypothetical protein
MLIDEYPPNKLRESFKLMGILVKARNTTGNIIFGIVICGLSIWGLHKLFPDIWDK